MTKSKLSVRFKNAPRDASLVPCSANKLLNREETFSATRKVRADNLGEENPLHNPMERRDLRVPVYVMNSRGLPLMPTTPRKARLLLKRGCAKVIKRLPFTIQLNYPTGETTQPIVLGIDAGYSTIGFSAVTNESELIAGEVGLRDDVSLRILKRRLYRHTRRNRLWYRPPRFNNRVGTKKKAGWLLA